mgnify:CR=1 FL=1
MAHRALVFCLQWRAGNLHVIAHSFLMNGNMVPVSTFVQHRTSSWRGQLAPWHAARARLLSSWRPGAQTHCGLRHHQRIQDRQLCFAVPPASSFAARPHCCGSAAHTLASKAHLAVQRSAASLGPMRHNLAVVRTGGSIAPPSNIVRARRTLPR